MTLLDRYIVGRFLANFFILFALLYLFAVTIDLILALDRFLEAAREVVGPDVGAGALTWTFVKLVVNFQAPRFFQFYAYLHGLVAVGAMAFTLAQMHRHKELVAMLAAGVSLPRIAMPFIVATFGLSLLQLVNQEFFLPRVAPLLLRAHGEIGQQGIESFAVDFTPDGVGNLLQSPAFNPATAELEAPTILERDDRGRTVRRITADTARWETMETPVADEAETNVPAGAWRLVNGRVTRLVEYDRPTDAASVTTEPIGLYPTDLSPRVLIVRRYGAYATMLSLRQIRSMLDTPGVVSREALRRYQYSRFSSVLVNVLVMWLALPMFLLRQPANLLVRSLMCAGITIPALLGAAIFMMSDLPGIPPAVGVFLPVVIFVPIVLAQWTYVRT